MIKCGSDQKQATLDYIGNDYGKCLYLYVDLLKYGLENENVHLWQQKDENGNICLIMLQYYTGVHLYSKDGYFDVQDVVDELNRIKPSMICGMETTIKQVESYIDGYEMETGLVGRLEALNDYSVKDCIRADISELAELAGVLAEDEALGKPYGYDLLYKQLYERYTEKFGRNYIYRNNGKIIATASTYAEMNKVAVISGVFVAPEWRGKGLSKKILSAICKELWSQNFDVYSYYYIESAHRMHKSVGFGDLGNWAKLVRMK